MQQNQYPQPMIVRIFNTVGLGMIFHILIISYPSLTVLTQQRPDAGFRRCGQTGIKPSNICPLLFEANTTLKIGAFVILPSC